MLLAAGLWTTLALAAPPGAAPLGAAPPGAAPTSQCVSGSIDLEWFDLLRGEAIANQSCHVNANRDGMGPIIPITLGRLEVGSFRVGREKLGFGLNLKLRAAPTLAALSRESLGVKPEPHYSMIYVDGSWEMPVKWRRAVDVATAAAAIGVTATVLVLTVADLLGR